MKTAPSLVDEHAAYVNMRTQLYNRRISQQANRGPRFHGRPTDCKLEASGGLFPHSGHVW